jgi:signal transduction histidine kinase
MKSQWLIVLLLFTSLYTNAQVLTYRDSLKQIIATTKEDTVKINALCNLGFSYTFVHQDSAILFANEGLELSQKTAYASGEANNNGVLCMALTLQGNYTSALQYGFNFLAIGEKLRDSIIIMRANDALAICYREQEDYSEALKYVHRAEVLSRTLGAKAGHWPFVLGNLSVIHERLNNLDSALYYGLKSYSLIKDWSGIYLKLGTIYTKLGKFDSALYYYRTGIPYAKEYFIYIDLVDIYSKMSELFQSTGNLDSAIYYGNKSVTQEGILSYSEGRIRAVTHLANLYETLGQKDSTLKYYKLSLQLNEKMFDREKIREAQSLAFNEKTHQQELKAQNDKEKNRIKMYGLLGLSVISLVIVFFLWRNNRQKQMAKSKVEQAYDNLKATQQQLIQSEKMASLGELTAGIAHEIQNPLNFVNNFSEVNSELIAEMKEEMEKGNLDGVKSIATDIEANEQKIKHHGKRADAIVKNMLQHSRTSSGQKEPTDINALADEYLRLAYHGLRAKDKSFNANFKTDFDNGIGKINIVPQEIGRVILNLINNAFYAVDEKKKHIPPSPKGEHGSILNDYDPVVTVTTKGLGPPLGDRGKIEIKVRDNGNGIPQKVLDKIFQPFFTTKPTGQGTGLGLSLSYDIVKAHGGELRVQTKEGEGSEFIIFLPAH